MRINDPCIASSCASMSNKKIVNGDSLISSNTRKDTSNESSKEQTRGANADSCIINANTSYQFSEGKTKGFKDRPRDVPYDHHSSGTHSPEHESGSNLQGSSVGGRLKFFKDGKFILELSHKKEGDKTCWIPVTKKPCWPSMITPRPGSLTSLSASDDNSSVVSFPWQRDHRWKQPSPRQCFNKHLEFTFNKKPNCRFISTDKSSYLRRKPFDLMEFNNTTNKYASKKRYKSENLTSVIQGLWERLIATKSEPDIVSPRKRILKEFEKVSLEESSKRQKGCVPGRVVSTYSIAAILDENDGTVLRTLLRSPSTSPDSVVSHSPSITSSYLPRDLTNPLPPVPFTPSNVHFPPYRVPQQSAWPVHYPLPNPLLSLPVYPVPPYLASSHLQQGRVVPPDPYSDTPLNLSKHSG